MNPIVKQLGQQLRVLLRPHAGWYALVAALMLTWLGSSAIETVSPGHAEVQTSRWLPVALTAMVLMMIPSPRWIGHMAYPVMVAAILLLIFVILPGVPRSIVPVRNGSTAWINLGFMSFQPSEMAKVGFVLALAWYLRFRGNHRSLLGLLIPFAIMFVPVILILKEPDLGSALLFAPTLFVMLVAAGAKLRHLGTILGLSVAIVGVVGAVTIYAPDQFQVLKGHQQDRIKAMYFDMMGDDRMTQREGYQQMVAKRMVAAGGTTGFGKERAATIIDYNDLPFDYNDMIFPVIVNRWGILGGLGTMALYGVLVTSILLVAARSKDPFARMSCVGFAGMIFTQASINIGMTVGLLPITGITLPLISYGGSSMLFTFIMVGLVINFAARRPQMLARPSFEFDNADAIFQ
ncbi:MAG: FtsW/RodA/SpoVE family cell cycle protein [Phycisphaeraceae bacterium]|nr:FtsW/RodA/SpoVE family cell cycle protein [Phycisphaeraceae bacterium]